ncbi:hypothetical protein H1220_08085 [Carnobacteriaceae bacterium zg-84]|uniref:hypothetical protein n=1 Tax=Granulicatella sp. zg-84 TaxID=2678503 RepID=UPI0013C217CD|nr:hypothetical protein [Granulicatella sp. zg-84]NEW66279.1 hypothetical protein [Granulicatella sp. zg-84]QMI85633.1 hypothetical protein H1220_08085 [Carnobacteriaceae bacterium zg-84]
MTEMALAKPLIPTRKETKMIEIGTYRVQLDDDSCCLFDEKQHHYTIINKQLPKIYATIKKNQGVEIQLYTQATLNIKQNVIYLIFDPDIYSTPRIEKPKIHTFCEHDDFRYTDYLHVVLGKHTLVTSKDETVVYAILTKHEEEKIIVNHAQLTYVVSDNYLLIK